MRVLLKRFGGRSTVAAMALASVLTMVGCGGSNSSLPGSNGTATPTFSPGAGSYNVSKDVTIADATKGAVMYCTTDGTTPTASSPVCAQPTTVFKTEFLQAIAIAPGKTASPVASAGYTITPNMVPTPTFNPAGGNFTGTQMVTISDSASNVNIYYTLDGSVPSANSTLYISGSPVAISQTSTLSAIAVAAGFTNSSVNSATYIIQAILPPPIVSGIMPTSASAGGGVLALTVNGTNFISGSTVQWNGVTQPTIFVSATQLTATIPASLIANAGTANVTVAQSSGISGAAAFTINSVTPAITAVSPSSGTVGTSVSITGTNFTGATAVSFGSTPATSFKVNSATSITAVAPAGTGTVDVTAVTPTGTSSTSAADQFTYTVPTLISISPATGPSTGGSSVAITGTNFTGATAVNFGTVPATSFKVNSATSITAVAPAGTGTVDVTVVTSNGTSATTAADQFVYTINAPAVTSISPAIGLLAGGTTVTITGVNFTDATAVNFGSTAATSITVNSTATSITAVSPAGTGTVDVTVVTPAGVSPTAATDQFAYGVAFNGTVSSGALPIVGATVQLYAAGTQAYGSGATPLTTGPSPIVTDASGKFSLLYACPTSGAPGDQVYLVASGGNTTSGPNPNANILLMEALGSCSQLALASPVTVNEVTTIASAYALSAFATINSSGGIDVGAPATGTTCNAAGNWKSTTAESCNYTGLANAFSAVNNLVNISTGVARTFTPAYKTDLAGDPQVVNNSTVPTARINALADMLASCVEGDGSGCGSGLFSAASTNGATTGTTPITPVDTLQAALNIAQNPGNNVTQLLGLVSSTSPYSITSPDPGSVALAVSGPGAPTDLTLALTFTGAGLGVGPGITLSDNNIGFSNAALSIDAGGNIWVAAYAFNLNDFSANGEVIAEFNALGAPVSKSTSIDAANNPTYGGYNPQPGSTTDGVQTNMLAVDQSGNLWTYQDGQTGNTVNALEISTIPGFSLLNTISILNVSAIADATSVAIDVNGNAWYASSNSTQVVEIHGDGTLGVVGVDINSLGVWGPLSSLTFDSGGGMWMAVESNPSGGADVLQVSPADGSLTYEAFPSSNMGRSYVTTLAADNGGNVYGCDPSGLNLNVFNASSSAAPTTYPIKTQRACGTQLVLDGQGHLFAPLISSFGPAVNYGYAFQFFANLDEFTTKGALISPIANGYTGSSSTESPTLNVDQNGSTAGGVVGTGAAIDESGNLWVLNPSAYGTNFSTGANVPANVLVEYIGIGAPVLTPVATALTNDMLGVRP
ncbi:beta strand repeat-containing protein [Acidicapsa ligni]|uniref:beta strand repeat-containing protein n=1 Tax=Acidicapsa ligni TaxID=542300 RepID=UPI0021E04FD7|nr:IPT/TIG domain-containing protein [Acidicapsa ligni]